MQAANVRSVGELFGSRAQVSRIAKLEAEVKELRALVKRVVEAQRVEPEHVSPRSVRVVKHNAYPVPVRVSKR